MQAVTGKLRAGGLPATQITLLTLGMLSAAVLPPADAGVGTVAGGSSVLILQRICFSDVAYFISRCANLNPGHALSF